MSSAAWATPVAHAAMPSRPASSAVRARPNPSPSAPISDPAASLADSKCICAVTELRMPILCSGAAAATPGTSAGTWKQLIPRPRPAPSGDPPVRANST